MVSCSLFGLVAMGRRTSGLRAEIAKAMRAAVETSRTPEAARLREGLGPIMGTLCRVAAELVEADPVEAEAVLVQTGKHLLTSGIETLPDDVPEELVRAAALTHYTDGISNGTGTLMQG
jgi:hypothetical protein